MAINKVIYGEEVLMDLTSDTVTSSTLLSGITAHDKAGNIITGIMSGGGGLPSGIKALKFGTINITTAFTTTRNTFTHDLGEVPDFVMVWHNGNIATTYSMLWALRSTQMGYRSSAYNSFMCYHGNSTTTATMTNSNSTSYGVSNLTTTTFQLASSSSSYYWRAGMYNWIAIKFE